MRKFVKISVALIILISGGCNKGQNNKPETIGINQDSGIAVYLTEQAFRDQVFDYGKNTEWKYEGTKPAIIDFYADWCAPCRELSPVLEEVAAEYGDKIILYKIDTVKEKKLAKKLGVTALPTLLYIPVKGKPQVRLGLVPRESLKQAIDEILLNKAAD